MPPRTRRPAAELMERQTLEDVERLAQQLAQEIQRRERLEERILLTINDLEASLRDEIASERLEVRRLRESLQDFARWICQ